MAARKKTSKRGTEGDPHETYGGPAPAPSRNWGVDDMGSDVELNERAREGGAPYLMSAREVDDYGDALTEVRSPRTRRAY